MLLMNNETGTYYVLDTSEVIITACAAAYTPRTAITTSLIKNLVLPSIAISSDHACRAVKQGFKKPRLFRSFTNLEIPKLGFLGFSKYICYLRFSVNYNLLHMVPSVGLVTLKK
jgi:hypothetical protein